MDLARRPSILMVQKLCRGFPCRCPSGSGHKKGRNASCLVTTKMPALREELRIFPAASAPRNLMVPVKSSNVTEMLRFSASGKTGLRDGKRCAERVDQLRIALTAQRQRGLRDIVCLRDR